MAKANKRRFLYPEPQEKRIGIKVRWYYYANESDARKAAEIAKQQAIAQQDFGFDFGYQVPGTIYPPGTQGFFPTLYEVCLP